MVVLGGMSGSSLDGLDLALVRFSNEASDKSPDWDFLDTITIPYHQTLATQLSEAPGLSAKELYLFSAQYSQLVAKMIQSFLDTATVRPSLIGWHGHTIFHNPEHQTTLQIGSGAAIAAGTGIDTVCDFRSIDMFLGGQGAPLAPLADARLIPDADYYVNLGGICNLSFKEEGAQYSGDLAACNQLLNHLSNQVGLPYDAEGEVARSGALLVDVLKEMNAVPYHHLPLPKSMDNSWVREHMLPIIAPDRGSIPDLLHTSVEYICSQIMDRVRSYPSGQKGSMRCTGGGANNTYLIERLESLCSRKNVTILETCPTLVDFKEALLMAYMALCFHSSEHNVISSVTGSSNSHVGGCLYRGSKSLTDA